MMGIATNCSINKHSHFARKNYFYPDLPKGYQISQFEKPVCENGELSIILPSGEEKKIKIKRIHLEEDAGKSIHDQGSSTLVDLNRSGIPLMEIVTEPDMHSAEEAYLYLSKIKQIVQYLQICDGNMEEGSLRCDANISIRPEGESYLGTKTEVKNMNSFKNVEKAINVEINRQVDLLEEGEKIIQQTLLWNADMGAVFPMRSKEEAHDYRYFPDPDLLPIEVSENYLNNLKHSLPELPDEKLSRFVADYSLPHYDASVLTSTKDIAEYYEKVVSHTRDFKSASNWIMVEVLKVLNERKLLISQINLPAQHLAKLVELINNNTISGKIAKEIFPEMADSGKDPEIIVKEKNLLQISDSAELEKIIESVMSKNENQVEEYRSGKEKVFGFFVGQVMKESRGKANPQLVNELLKHKLGTLK
jgi:aspartyl-tRNA(Asn)/glutamyl-tRNA(Gln) amidotransferase subunit B